MQDNKKIVVRSLILVLISIGLAYIFSPLIGRNYLADLKALIVFNREQLWLIRHDWMHELQTFNAVRFVEVEMTTVLFIFIGYAFVIGPKKYSEILFKYRWIVGMAFLLFLVLNKINGDSLAIIGTVGRDSNRNVAQFVNPIFGVTRPIRSDEYIVSNPLTLYKMVNESYFSSLGIIGYLKDPCMFVARIVNIFGMEYTYSFIWNYLTIFGVLFSIDFFMLLTKGKRKISIVCTMMIFLSSFYLWWNYPSQISYMQAAIVAADRFIKSDTKPKRVLWLYLTGIFAFNFAANLYPAWQVPCAYVGLCLLAWLIYTDWSYIRKFGKFEYALLIGAFIVAIVAIALYVYISLDYIHTNMNSAYPGHRIDCGGNDPESMDKLYAYFVNTFFAYKDYNVLNNCEMATLISFFPVPTIILWLKLIRDKKKDLLAILLTLVSALLFVYCFIGFPKIIAVVTLLQFSTVARAVDYIAYIQILMLAIYFAYEREDEKVGLKTKLVDLIIAILVVVLVIRKCIGIQTGYLSTIECLILAGLFGITIFLLCFKHVKYRYNIVTALIAFICLLTGIYIRPMTVGLQCVYSRPTADAIKDITKMDDGKWIALDGDYVSSYATLCGANVINMVNTSPNLELWSKVDEDGQYVDAYNRFAHITVSFTDEDTSFSYEEAIPDCFTLDLSYKDISKLDVKYLISMHDIEEFDNDYVKFEKIYDEDYFYIYEIYYK